MKRGGIRSRVHRVTVEEKGIYEAVALRDGGCQAPILDPDVDECAGRMTFQHVKEGPGAPRVTDPAHLLVLCEHHHIWSGWATSKRGLERQRDRLRALYPGAWR